MKTVFKSVVAVCMAAIMGVLPTMKVFAAETAPQNYIREVKVYLGDYSAAASEGFTLLKNGDNPVDLNQNAGGGLASKGEKAVYLGYKTTADKSEAITDLALMNMKGGYSVKDYEYLMRDQMKAQIIPLVDGFLAAINEYRENYEADVQRAVYIHDVLNKFIDDDTGKGLGDLLLNQTKYELGDAAYNALSAAEKKNHADILTIVAQSNGKATLMMENLITRAADSNDTTWLDRLSGITYDVLVDSTGLPPTDANKQLAKLYDDTANQILDMWDDLSAALLAYDDATNRVEKYDISTYEKALDAMNKVTDDTSDEEAQKILDAFEKAQIDLLSIKADLKTIAIHDALEQIDYEDGTMLDFFTTDADELVDDITLLYPFAASLTNGQRAGLEFISLKELLIVALTDEDGYSDEALNNLHEISIYDGVDRDIYDMCAVALTSDAQRAKAFAEKEEERSMFSGWSIAMMAVTGATFLAFTGSAIGWGVYANKVSSLTKTVNSELSYYEMAYEYPFPRPGRWNVSDVYRNNPEWKTQMEALTSKSLLCKGLTVGFGIAMIVLAGITTYLTWQDMKEYYNVPFTAIPRYMVDEKDITAYNKKGEKVVIKNQLAYYKVVDCNRTEADEMYTMLGVCSDMNGDVGKQWLALYAAKNEVEEPILASSLKVVVGKTDIPAGYETGIHMFGTDAAFNLNSSLYDWNNDAESVYVYFQTDDTAASTTGSNFTAGTLALSGGAGIALGAVVTALAMKTKKKSDKKEAIAE